MDVNYKISRQFQSYSNVDTELSVSSLDNIGSTDNQSITMTYEVKLRTKILKNEGTKYANIDIVYFNMEDDSKMYDEFGRVKVTVLSQNEKGKVQKSDVKASNFTDERVNKNYKVRHIVVPDVKAGDIIEYQYEITSTRISYIYDCSFQEENIPVLYAKCEMNIPAMLQFNMNTPVHPFIKSKAEAGVIHGELAGGDMQASKSYPSNHYTIEGHDILPKALDLQRKNPTADAAKVSSEATDMLKTLSAIKNPGVAKPAPIPAGKAHLMMAR